MIKYSDIHRAIVREIKSKYGNITFSTDIEEGITRPSFFIDFDNVVANDFMREALDREITVRIYYFSTTIDNNKIELLNMEDDLNDLFLKDNILELEDGFIIEIDTLNFSVIDKVLHCYFDLMISESYNRKDDTPLMEELEMEG